jgi:DNA-binding protein HU-beta
MRSISPENRSRLSPVAPHFFAPTGGRSGRRASVSSPQRAASWAYEAASLRRTLEVELKNVTKADIVDSLANEHELSKRQAGEIVDLILDEITTALKQGEKVQLIPFGSFVVRDRKARTGRNPQTGEVLKIAARRVPAFTPGKGLKDAVGGPKRGGAKKSGRKK